MKKILYSLFMFIFLFIFISPAYAASDYYRDIVVNFNYEGCPQNANKEVTIQLFADGKKVDGQEVVLNSSNNFSHTYEDLLIFKPETPNEIRYEVKMFEDGIYKLISPRSYSYEKGEIKKWVHILPENIEEGHTYVISLIFI